MAGPLAATTDVVQVTDLHWNVATFDLRVVAGMGRLRRRGGRPCGEDPRVG